MHNRFIFVLMILSVILCCGLSGWAKSSEDDAPLFTTQITVIRALAASNVSDSHEYFDDTPPVVCFSSPEVWESSCSGKPLVSISGTASDNADLVSVKWENQNGQTGVCVGTSSWKSSSVPISEGENLICVTAEDSAGNVGAASIIVTYNASGPSVNIISPTANSNYTTTGASLTISGTAIGDRKINGITWSTDQGFSGSCTGTNDWCAADVPLVVGNNLFTVTAVDSAGESGYKTLNINVPDTINPQIKIVAPTPDLASRRIGATIPVSGTASDNFSLKQISWQTDRGHSGVCIGKDIWNIPKLPLEVGENKLTVIATDTANNTTQAELLITRQTTNVEEAYRGLSMVSLPMLPDYENPKTEVGFYDNSWASYNAELEAYNSYPDAATFLLPRENTAGRGFWAGFIGTVADPLGYATPLRKEVQIHLYPGWNIVGNPYNQDMLWKTEKIMIKLTGANEWLPMDKCEDYIRNYAIGWQQDPNDPMTGDYFVVADVIQEGVANSLVPWRGYWIKAFEECEMLFPVPEPTK